MLENHDKLEFVYIVSVTSKNIETWSYPLKAFKNVCLFRYHTYIILRLFSLFFHLTRWTKLRSLLIFVVFLHYILSFNGMEIASLLEYLYFDVLLFHPYKSQETLLL